MTSTASPPSWPLVGKRDRRHNLPLIAYLFPSQRGFRSAAALSRFQYAVLGSLIVHALLMFGIVFTPPAAKPGNVMPPLEVVLVNAKVRTEPQQADAYAQHNLDGGGNTENARRAKSPLPVTRDDKQSSDLMTAARRVEQLEQEARRLLTQAQSQVKVETAPAQPQVQAEKGIAPTAVDILSRTAESVRLLAQIDKNLDDYNSRPRRRFVGARTKEYRFARYIEDWRMKVERVGTFNYPQAARDQKIYGSLMLTVSIKADGTVENIEINRSSGHRVLDEAARRIVNLAAPYSAFPQDIAADTDVLSITRTWTFTRSDQLLAE